MTVINKSVYGLFVDEQVGKLSVLAVMDKCCADRTFLPGGLIQGVEQPVEALVRRVWEQTRRVVRRSEFVLEEDRNESNAISISIFHRIFRIGKLSESARSRHFHEGKHEYATGLLEINRFSEKLDPSQEEGFLKGLSRTHSFHGNPEFCRNNPEVLKIFLKKVKFQ